MNSPIPIQESCTINSDISKGKPKEPSNYWNCQPEGSQENMRKNLPPFQDLVNSFLPKKNSLTNTRRRISRGEENKIPPSRETRKTLEFKRMPTSISRRRDGIYLPGRGGGRWDHTRPAGFGRRPRLKTRLRGRPGGLGGGIPSQEGTKEHLPFRHNPPPPW